MILERSVSEITLNFINKEIDLLSKIDPLDRKIDAHCFKGRNRWIRVKMY